MIASSINGKANAYLVQGLPSVLARRVIEQVLCFEPRSRVYAIIHEDDADYTQKLLFEFESAQRSRVELIYGDLTAIDFGLAGSDYLLLANSVTRVHHIVAPSAVFVDGSNYSDVGAALGREIIEFARTASSLESLVVYSSAMVSGDRTGTVKEDELAQGQSFRGFFERALALMELMLLRTKGEVPAVVLRPTLMSADSQTGECERTSPIFRLVEAMLSLPEGAPLAIPSDRAPVHLVSTDYVARVAYYLGRRVDSIGKTLHITDKHPADLAHTLELLAKSAGQTARMSAMPAGLNQKLQQPVSGWSRLYNEIRGPRVFYDARQATALLNDCGIACPAFEDYADKIVSFVRGKRA
jgi:thioester reductase-like protein